MESINYKDDLKETMKNERQFIKKSNKMKEDVETPLTADEFLAWHDGKDGAHAPQSVLDKIYKIFSDNGSDESEDVNLSYAKLPVEMQLEVTKIVKSISDVTNKATDDENLEEDKKKDKVIVFGKDTKLKEEARKIPYGMLAWQLNEIISGMDNSEAYWGPWLDIWPDGSTRQSAIEDFDTKEEYEELEDLFKKVYKAYHRDGLYNVSKKVLDRAHSWDQKLGLKPIVDIKYEKPNKFEDDYEEKIGEELNKAGIDNDAFDIKEERDDGADYSYKALYFYDNGVAKKAFNALKNSGKFASVTTYVEPSPDDFHSSVEVIVSEHKEEGEE